MFVCLFGCLVVCCLLFVVVAAAAVVGVVVVVFVLFFSPGVRPPIFPASVPRRVPKVLCLAHKLPIPFSA